MEIILALIFGLPICMVVWVVGAVVKKSRELRREREYEAIAAERRRQENEIEEEREKLERLRERQSVIQEYKELMDGFARLVSDGSSPWDELTRTAKALYGGTGSVSLEETVMGNVERILRGFAVADGMPENRLGKLYYALSYCLHHDQNLMAGEQHGRTCYASPSRWTTPLSVKHCTWWMEDSLENRQCKPAELPSAVKSLSAFDELRKTHLAADAAAAYASLIIRASECCSPSMAVDALRTRYLALLQPYLSADFNHHRGSSSEKFNGNCPECKQYYAVLRIPEDADEETIRNAYRNFAKIYHPDRLQGKSERQTAEDEMKQLNVAYKHIMKHFECVKA